jgi:hypothetical protein
MKGGETPYYHNKTVAALIKPGGEMASLLNPEYTMKEKERRSRLHAPVRGRRWRANAITR